MTESLTAPITLIGEPAESCDGDFCAIPEHHTQAVINRKLDDDAV
jgi:hypothetical protein